MAGLDYDGIAGVVRLLKAGGSPDPFSIFVLTYHAVIESEVEGILTNRIPNPERVFEKSPKLSFGHKVNLLHAFWAGDDEKGRIAVKVLVHFNEVRNAIAHPSGNQIKNKFAGLVQAYREIDGNAGDDIEILEIAQGICLFLQDGSDVSEFKTMADALAKVVNETMPAALGVPRDASEIG